MIPIFIAGSIGMIVSLIGTRVLMVIFARLGKGQPILGAEDHGPVHQMGKQGTPTMGGIAILFAGAILFHIVTLPVEFDASSRALRLIDELGILQGEENRGARSVLNAAAWTYVATAIYAALQLVQLLLIRGDR